MAVNNYNFYEIYGLKLKTNMKMKELYELKSGLDDKYKVNVNIEKVPSEIKKLADEGYLGNYLKDEVWFNIRDLAIYHIKDGRDISIEPYDENVDKDLMKAYLLGSGLGFTLFQKGMVAIHGGTTVLGNKGVIFTGDRGAGKSTLTTALRQRGHKFVTDDVSVLTEESPYLVYPGYPQQKICVDVMKKLGYDKFEFTQMIGDNREKYLIPVTENREEEPVSLDAICHLCVGDVDDIVVEEITGVDKINTIKNNIYRIDFIGNYIGLPPVYFKKILEIAKNVPIYKITRPRDKFTLDEQISIIEEMFTINN